MPPAPSTMPSLKITKSFTFRGGPRLWSNRYHFAGGTPANSTQWTTLADAVVAAERAIYSGGGQATTIVGATGYEAGSEIPVFSKTYTTVGTGAWSAGPFAPGDAAVYIRYSTAVRTAKNHPLYLFNYHHGIVMNNATAVDNQLAAQKTAFQTYATAWITGFSDGSHTCGRAGPHGAVATGSLVGPWVTHRDFPRG